MKDARLTRKIIAGCLAMAACMVCAQTLAAQSQAAASGPLYKEVVDEMGRTVRIPQPVNRIVSLAPSLTETVYAMGLQDRLVGDTDYCDYPADAQKKTKVGGAINPSIEQIVALRPDLVLITKGLNRPETARALDGRGIASYATDPHTVREIISSTEKLAGVLGAAEAGTSLGADLEKHLTELQQRLVGIPPRRVLFVVWPEPLISAGKGTFIADALRYAGAVSVIESTQDWPQISLEEVVKQQPEFLVFAASHSESGSNDFESLATRPGWRGLEAVSSKHFAVISDAVNRTSPRILSAIEDLARQLHPDAFAEKPGAVKENLEKEISAPSQRPSASPAPPLISLTLPNILPEECACGR